MFILTQTYSEGRVLPENLRPLVFETREEAKDKLIELYNDGTIDPNTDGPYDTIFNCEIDLDRLTAFSIDDGNDSYWCADVFEI